MSLQRSLPRICIAMGFPDVPTLLAHAEKEVEAGERFLEFRLDYLPRPEQGIGAISQFLARHPECTLMATCRRHQNHGKFNGSVEEQIRILEAAVQAGAKAIDIELESAENAVPRVESLRAKVMVVLSYHNWGGTPSLDAVVRRMLRISADAYKVVTTARKPSDNYRVLSLAKTHPKAPLIMLAMGEMGLPSRVLSTAFGGLYTYAAPNQAEGTAAGQVAAKVLRNLYRVDRMPKSPKVFGVIADPVRHSISPLVHNRAFQTRRIDAVYIPILVHAAQLKDFLLFAGKVPLSGFSVTLPHKQKILRYLDVVDSMARRIGAVNTVWRKAGKWRGTNTDVDGVLTPLSRHLRLGKASVLVVGNGGAARGAAFALSDAGAKISIAGRNADRVRALAKACGAEPLSKDQAEKSRFDVVLHATPLGMAPNVNQCYFDGPIPGEIVFDMVYNPRQTLLLKRAAEQGKTVISGLEMFIEQAVKQFEIWTGESAPRSVMEKCAQEALGAAPPVR
ncbi:MAG: shikimate dehydrogenase [Bryobacteraceae bacterium]|nr:shikimate dehydrogenase [Bryobacteraceae bacterium]